MNLTKKQRQQLFNYFSIEHDVMLMEDDYRKIESVFGNLTIINQPENFYCWDDEALGKESRCNSQCDICQNKGNH